MKLKPDLITLTIDGTRLFVPVGAETFRGTVRSSRAAALIADCLKEEVTAGAMRLTNEQL